MPRRSQPTIGTTKLDKPIAQATIDCYNDSEQVTGLFTMIEDYLALPFQTTVLGVPVTVARVDVTTTDQIVAICTRDRHRQTLPILDLPLPDPAGYETLLSGLARPRGRPSYPGAINGSTEGR